MKKLLKGKTVSRQDAKGAEQTEELLAAEVCASAPWREAADFFTPCYAMGYTMPPAPRAEFINESVTHHTSGE